MITLGDGIAGLFSIPEGEASLVLSDLPSGDTRAEFDKPPNLRMFWHACWRALKPDGVVIVMASSLRFASELMRSTPYYRYDMIWEKSMATGFLNAHSRPLRNHEFVLCFFRTEGTYNPQMWESGVPISKNSRSRADNNYNLSENYGANGAGGLARAGATDRYPVSVIKHNVVGTTDPERTHPQQKPVPLLRHFVRTYSNPGELVVDPYAGSGSSGEAAIVEGRRFLGWDSNPRFAQPEGQP